MDSKTWLLTWTTYGTWLPGDERGFVSAIREAGQKVRHNIPGTPPEHDIPALQRYSREVMRGDPVYLTKDQAQVVTQEFLRTARFRGWHLLAGAVMANHVHLVVAVPESIGKDKLLQEFKSYGSRVLNARFGARQSGTWWTRSGSARTLRDEEAVFAAVEYVRQQEFPLVVRVFAEDGPE